MRRVAVVTGTRAEYGLLRRTMRGIAASKELSLSTIATGMHLSPQHGRSVTEIRDDGFEVTQTVRMLLDDDTTAGTAKSFGIGVSGLSQAFDAIEPDFLLVLGDRIEAFAGAVAAAMMNVPVGHIAGGSVRGGGMIDESIRHSITRFAHVHFVQSEGAAETLQAVGEHPRRIHTVGAPALDEIRDESFADGEAVVESLGLSPADPVVVVLQHPVTTKPDEAGEQMRETLSAVEAIGCQAVVIHPNSDPGRSRIVSEIQQYCDRNDGFVDIPTLPREEYLGLLAVADALVGNSSSGIVEAPCFGLPVVDVGPRQGDRDRADIVTHVPHDGREVEQALSGVVGDGGRRDVDLTRSPYYLGGASENIVAVIERLDEFPDLLKKRVQV